MASDQLQKWSELLRDSGYVGFENPRDLMVQEAIDSDVQVIQGGVKNSTRVSIASIDPELEECLRNYDEICCHNFTGKVINIDSIIDSLLGIRDKLRDHGIRRKFIESINRLEELKSEILEIKSGTLSELLGLNLIM